MAEGRRYSASRREQGTGNRKWIGLPIKGLSHSRELEIVNIPARSAIYCLYGQVGYQSKPGQWNRKICSLFPFLTQLSRFLPIAVKFFPFPTGGLFLPNSTKIKLRHLLLINAALSGDQITRFRRKSNARFRLQFRANCRPLHRLLRLYKQARR